MKFRKMLVMLAATAMVFSFAGNAAAEDDVVIIFTNDTHCEVNGELGFADVAVMEKIEKDNGNHVIIADAGDAVQGGAIGALSKGSYIIEIINKVGYDVAAIGNHEFDYGIETLMKLSESTEFPYISANFISLEDNKSVFEEYHMEKAGDIDIAFVGVTTPNTFTSSAPEYFKNDEGKFVYDFCGGDELFGVVQKSVDAAIEAGAEYVIAVTHMGVDDADRPYTSKELIANTVGIDAVIDAHSHTVIENELCKNKVGKDVPISSSGSKFEHIGMVRILSDGTVSTKLIDESYKENGLSERFRRAVTLLKL